VFYLTYETDLEDTYKFPAKIFNLPSLDFYSKINREYYQKLLKSLSIDIIINHDASNERSKLWLKPGKYQVKKISLYHCDPLHGLKTKAESKYYIINWLINSFPLLFEKLKIINKKKEINFLLKNSSKLVLLSTAFEKEIGQKLVISSSKIASINNPHQFHVAEKVSPKKKKILFVSRLELVPKRPDIMLLIWSRLQNIFHDWELLFLGDGPDRGEVEYMCRKLGLRNVKFMGYVDPVPYYREASLLCMTSDYEGFGLVLPEAMHFGVVPITFFNWASLNDIILDGETGILINNNDVDEFSNKLSQLITNDADRMRIAQNAMKISNRFNINNIGPQWLRLFSTL
jgi:glycosyltransferase involved in cell wall biosynthesis